MIPAPWPALVLALAVFRLCRLAGWDDFPPVAKLRAKVTGEHVYYDSTVDRDGPLYRFKHPVLAHFLACAYCLGFWISIATYLLWLWFPTETLYGAAAFALSAAVGIIARRLDP